MLTCHFDHFCSLEDVFVILHCMVHIFDLVIYSFLVEFSQLYVLVSRFDEPSSSELYKYPLA